MPVKSNTNAAKNRKRRERKREEDHHHKHVEKKRRSGDDDGDEEETGEGAFGRYGNAKGKMSEEDDDWATTQRAWDALAVHLLPKFKDASVWMPFWYDGKAGARLKSAGFSRVKHANKDFFKVVKDSNFLKNVDVVIDNPPYTGKKIKEQIVERLTKTTLPFCLLLPLGVLHARFARKILDASKVQVLIPKLVWVKKKDGEEVPFKYLVWLCHGLHLDRDLVLMNED